MVIILGQIDPNFHFGILYNEHNAESIINGHCFRQY